MRRQLVQLLPAEADTPKLQTKQFKSRRLSYRFFSLSRELLFLTQSLFDISFFLISFTCQCFPGLLRVMAVFKKLKVIDEDGCQIETCISN